MKITYRIFVFLLIAFVSFPLFGQEDQLPGSPSWQIDLFARFQRVEPKYTILDQVDSFPQRTSFIDQTNLAREYTVIPPGGDTLLFLSNAEDVISTAPKIKFLELTATLHRRFNNGLSVFAGITYGKYSSASKQQLSQNDLGELGDAYESVINKENYLGAIIGADYYINRKRKWQPFIGVAADWYVRKFENEAIIFGIPSRDYYEEDLDIPERQLRSTVFDGDYMIRLGVLYEISPNWSATVMWRSDQLSRRNIGLLPGISLRYGW